MSGQILCTTCLKQEATPFSCEKPDCPMPPDTSAEFLHGLFARLTPAVVERSFINELGNQIKITIEGPHSISENTLTGVEAAQLSGALNGVMSPEDHKWFDPECGVNGCQSLIWKGRYESAVRGRQDFRQAYRAALGDADERHEWRDISTAPKDGTWVLIYSPLVSINLYPMTAFWNDGWMSVVALEAFPATHWMPLPTPPAA